MSAILASGKQCTFKNLLWDILCSLSPDKIESAIIRVVTFFHLPSSWVLRSLVPSSNLSGSCFVSWMLLLNYCTLSRKYLHSFIRSLRMVTLLILLISFFSLMKVMLASVMLSKLLLWWMVISSCLIVLSTAFTFLVMHALLELSLAMVSWLFPLTSSYKLSYTEFSPKITYSIKYLPIKSFITLSLNIQSYYVTCH